MLESSPFTSLFATPPVDIARIIREQPDVETLTDSEKLVMATLLPTFLSQVVSNCDLECIKFPFAAQQHHGDEAIPDEVVIQTINHLRIYVGVVLLCNGLSKGNMIHNHHMTPEENSWVVWMRKAVREIVVRLAPEVGQLFADPVDPLCN